MTPSLSKKLPRALLPAVLLIASCTGPRATLRGSGPPVLDERSTPIAPVELTRDDALLAELPPLDREFRGVWIATVDNIDWPSEPGLPTGRQQAEMIAILDRARALNLNAVVFQVRPTADAFYASSIEPWSAYLTGHQGKAPDPYYDPLEFAIEEAHRRGLELHAWINPFRAYHPTADEVFDTLSVALKGYTVPYGTQRWMDPGNPDAVEHTLRVIRDIAERYDVDGIHMDDYFYPYPVSGAGGDAEPFPDDATWNAYRAAGGQLTRPEWRRQNVDTFIERVYTEIKEIKPWVKFGVSPFGIWRPGNPEGITGFDAYNGIYADSRKWLVNGWVDYLSPQLYWSMDSEGQSYPRLLDWWIGQNVRNRHIWPGNFTSRIILEGSSYWGASELIRQILHTQQTTGTDGNIHFSMRALMPASHEMGDRLYEAAYLEPAVVPASPWLGGTAPAQPSLRVTETTAGLEATLSQSDSAAVWLWALRTLVDGQWMIYVVPGSSSAVRLPTGYGGRAPDALAVSALDRTGLEGPAVAFRLPGSVILRRGW